MSAAAQPDLFGSLPGHSHHVPRRDWARPGLVDKGFVERSVVAMREMPDAECQLRQAILESMESIKAIDLVYGTAPNEWATATRERLWLRFFTAEAILRRLKPLTKSNQLAR
jgi:hypothetical protein